MMSSGTKPNKRTIVDALVLAFSHSAVRDVVGTDALRSVLEVEYHELLTGSEFNLQPLWDLLSEQPGFVAEDAAPPVCVFASWGNQLNIQVTLPQSVLDLGPAACNQQAAKCRIPNAEIDAILSSSTGETTPQPHVPSEGLPPSSTEFDWDPSAGQIVSHKTRPPWQGIIAAIVAIITFGIAATQLLKHCNKAPDWAPIPSEFSGKLPIKNPVKFGKQVTADITDPQWMKLPEKQKREQLSKALLALDGIKVLALKDKTGKVRATVQISGSKERLYYTFH